MAQSENISEVENDGTWKVKEVIMEIPHWVFLFVGEIAFHQDKRLLGTLH